MVNPSIVIVVLLAIILYLSILLYELKSTKESLKQPKPIMVIHITQELTAITPKMITNELIALAPKMINNEPTIIASMMNIIHISGKI